MKISILNKQNKIKVTKPLRDLIKSAITQTLKYLSFEREVEVSVMLTDDEDIRALNSLHRNQDRPTDVLSFPMEEWEEEDAVILLGDIVISLERAAAQAEEYGHSLEREVGFLTVHSMLHLFGYDHEAEGPPRNDENEIFTLQEKILDKMGLTR